MGFFDRLKEGLTKARDNFTGRIQELVGLSTKIDEDFFEELITRNLFYRFGIKSFNDFEDC